MPRNHPTNHHICRYKLILPPDTRRFNSTQKGLEIVDSHTYKMGNRFVRVENITDDGRVGLILLLKAHYKEEDSWIVFYPTDEDRKALKKFLKLLDDRILYNKRAFWSFYKNNGGNK